MNREYMYEETTVIFVMFQCLSPLISLLKRRYRNLLDTHAIRDRGKLYK